MIQNSKAKKVTEIPLADSKRFFCRIPAFLLTVKQDGHLNGSWELDLAEFPGDDDCFLCSVCSLPTPVSWLGSYTMRVIAAMSGTIDLLLHFCLNHSHLKPKLHIGAIMFAVQRLRIMLKVNESKFQQKAGCREFAKANFLEHNMRRHLKLDPQLNQLLHENDL
nr:hypothetical protein [Tanacetum cinerariifolium]